MNSSIKILKEEASISCRSILYWAKKLRDLKHGSDQLCSFSSFNTDYEEIFSLLERDFYEKYRLHCSPELLKEAKEIFGREHPVQYQYQKEDVYRVIEKELINNNYQILIINLIEKNQSDRKAIIRRVFSDRVRSVSDSVDSIDLFSYQYDHSFCCLGIYLNVDETPQITEAVLNVFNYFKDKPIIVIDCRCLDRDTTLEKTNINISRSLTVLRGTDREGVVKGSYVSKVPSQIKRQLSNFIEASSGWSRSIVQQYYDINTIELNFNDVYLVDDRYKIVREKLETDKEYSESRLLSNLISLVNAEWIWWMLNCTSQRGSVDYNANTAVLYESLKVFLECYYGFEKKINF